MAQAQSLTSFMMTADVPWPDDSPPADRFGTLDAVALYEGATPTPCSVRKISPLGATLRGAGARTVGAQVAVELPTGQRAPGTVEWTRGDEAGVRFKQPIDMLALLNRKLLEDAPERRKMPRVELRCPVGVKWGVNVAAARLRNISAKGLQVEGDGLPLRDTFVSLFIDGLNVPAGEIVWAKDGLAGIELMDEVSWSSLMPWIRDQHRAAAAA
jgi:hypothetical protein